MKKTHIITHHFNGTLYNKYASTQHHGVDIVDEWHRKRFGSAFKSTLGYHIGYYKLFLRDGTVIKCREAWEEQAHTLGMNGKALGYGFAGNFTKGSKDTLTDAQINSFVREAKADAEEFDIPVSKFHAHRLYATYKDCHGDKYSVGYFQGILRQHADSAEDVAAHEEQLQKQLTGLMGLLRLLIQKLSQQLAERKARTLGAIYRKSSMREVNRVTKIK